MNRHQLEIGFERHATWRPGERRRTRLTRARWWFKQMRHVVDQALDWPPIPATPPKQTCLPLTLTQYR